MWAMSHDESPEKGTRRRHFLLTTLSTLMIDPPEAHPISPNDETAFHSAAYGREEYTNSIVASRDTNISPKVRCV